MNPTTVQPRGCTNFRLRQLSRRVARWYDAELAQAGLKGTQFSALSVIARSAGIGHGALARELGMDASTLTRNLRVLIDNGWVELGAGPDARTRTITLTDTGRRTLDAGRVCWQRAQRGLNARLGVDRVVALHALLDEGLAALDEPDAPRDTGP